MRGLLRELKMPVVTTLHTVLREPNFEQRRVMQELIARSTRLVVMTQRAKQMLQEVYQAPPAKINLIPHGIPDIPLVDPNSYKAKFGVDGKVVLLTFGLLSPNKGIEQVLNALPQILAEFPDVVYVVMGATHPHELQERGEAYRMSLENSGQEEQGREERYFLQSLRRTRRVERVHWGGGPLHYAVPQRSANHLGRPGLRLWRG